MTPAEHPVAEILRAEIESAGPILFRRFMEVSLYHPRHGYYRRPRDPFGKHGDYYTAEQLQPVFGLLIARIFETLWPDHGRPPHWTVVELGAGRREMAPYFERFTYVPVDLGGRLPERFDGFVFANEFFDALPVDVVARRNGRFLLMRVGLKDGSFAWIEGEEASGAAAAYLDRYAGALPDDGWMEVNPDALRWIDQVGEALGEGCVLIFDYGYDARELLRFPQGTLMAYRRHMAIEDVLLHPGDQDITAHLCFTALEERSHQAGFETLRRESMGRTLLRVGENDQFACVLEGVSESERQRRLMQLKSLVFGMGDTFRTLLLRKRRQ